eukprot:TRINITY_DN20023_c0_g1_i1.p1 TRINITY_DN20023_c0_g1~~TRINITY_DN20023_c0_g1_i1.p1  ORF type:complete len:121 (-),score=8.18 TRINITY_DN20023_c0_g1_i1:383-745(-)
MFYCLFPLCYHRFFDFFLKKYGQLHKKTKQSDHHLGKWIASSMFSNLMEDMNSCKMRWPVCEQPSSTSKTDKVGRSRTEQGKGGTNHQPGLDTFLLLRALVPTKFTSFMVKLCHFSLVLV